MYSRELQPRIPDERKATLKLKPSGPHTEKAKGKELQPKKNFQSTMESSTIESGLTAKGETIQTPVKTKSVREVKKPLRFFDEKYICET